MPRTSDPIDALLAHNLWATRLILEKCRGGGVTDEQFRRPFPIGPGDHGGLHAILTHIIGAMRRWADRIAERPARPPIESWRPGYQPRAPYTPDELLALLEEAQRDLAAVIADARQKGLDREICIHFTSPEGMKTFAFTAGVGVASAAAHGHYHRAQCMNILRQLGVAGASIDVIDWQEEAEGA